MELSYTFYDRKEEPYDFDYEISDSEVKEFLETNIGLDRLVKDAKATFSNMSQEDKQQVLNDLLDCYEDAVKDGEPDYPVLIHIDLTLVLETGLLDIDDYMEELSDAFRDDAEEAWEDSRVDDYTRYGVSPYDFV